MCALLSFHFLHDPGRAFDNTGSCYHDDGSEIANDAAISKQRAHVRFLTLHGLSYFTEAFHFSSCRQLVSFAVIFPEKISSKKRN